MSENSDKFQTKKEQIWGNRYVTLCGNCDKQGLVKG